MLDVPIAVRFRDLDSLGHINNVVYFTYCEVATNKYWTRLFGTRCLAKVNFILAHADLDYRAQGNEDHDSRVSIRASFIGTTSFGFEYWVVKDETGRLLAEGHSVQVAFDYKTNEKVPMPGNVRARILEFEGEGTELRGAR